MSNPKCIRCANTVFDAFAQEVQMCPQHFNEYVLMTFAGRTSFPGRVTRIDDELTA